MRRAVIKFSGRQYLISEGEEIVADKQNLIKADSSFNISEVLLFADGDDIRLGQPYVENAAVTAKIVSDFKGEKIKVRKFKSKARYRKTIGFRPKLCKVKIEKISLTEEEKVKEPLSAKEKKSAKPVKKETKVVKSKEKKKKKRTKKAASVSVKPKTSRGKEQK